MNTSLNRVKTTWLALTLAVTSFTSFGAEEKSNWWNPAWTQKQSVTIDGGPDAAALPGPVTGATILVRLPYGTFLFDQAREDGSDLRFIGADGKTVLPHQIESYDPSIGEGYVWVKVPEIKAGEKQSINLYYGNQDPALAPAAAGEVYDSATKLAYHFAGSGPPADSTANKNNADAAGSTVLSALVGSGLRVLPGTPIPIPSTATTEWSEGQAFTMSIWLKADSLQPSATVLQRGEGASAFQVLLENGVPVVVSNGARSSGAAPLVIGTWTHLAVVSDGKSFVPYVNGSPSAPMEGQVAAAATPILLGGAGDATFAGEIDEFSLSDEARSAAWVKLTAINQGNSDASQRATILGTSEGGVVEAHGGMMEHLSLFGDIASNMMFDGWIAIGVCALMIIVGWTVAVKKFLYLNSIEKGTNIFLRQWKNLSTDLTALDPDDMTSISSLGGVMNAAEQGQVQNSPLYHIYQIGSDEIRHRLDRDNNRVEGLSGRSIQAIRASLDAGLVHESHRLTDGLVYLTISIAGGPYVGLLGTVVGVMITFAIIAKSGEVNVNSIAPGIASALLATVVGLVVAIPALFIYSYLNGRIKNSLALMQVFIDEFVAKMAEFYRPAKERDASQ